MTFEKEFQYHYYRLNKIREETKSQHIEDLLSNMCFHKENGTYTPFEYERLIKKIESMYNNARSKKNR